jgi:transcriptional regulator with XRE-family HTH domain
MDINSLTASRIKEVRMSLGLKAETVALDLEMDKGSYSNLENGKTQVSIAKLYRIAEVFGVSYNMLLPFAQTPHQTINIHNGENQVFNGPQINNYTDKQLIQALGNSIETMQKVMDWMQNKGG